MARQSRLEKEAIEVRNEALLKNPYSKDDQYSSEHEDAMTHDDENHPLGKGDPNGNGEIFVVPDENKSKTEIKHQINTTTGGGSYDKYGRNNVGGRQASMLINNYGPDNEYGVDSIDTSINVDEYDQYTFSIRTVK